MGKGSPHATCHKSEGILAPLRDEENLRFRDGEQMKEHGILRPDAPTCLETISMDGDTTRTTIHTGIKVQSA